MTTNSGAHEVWHADVDVSVEITVRDASAILRCVENHDDEGVPQPDERGGTGWRNTYYALRTPVDVMGHLAYNCVANGVKDASRLDGWADLERDAVTMRVADADPHAAVRLRANGDFGGDAA